MPKIHPFPDHQNDCVIDACPFCLGTDGYLNVSGAKGCAHLGVCLRCRVAWDAAFELWDTWKGETEADWNENLDFVQNLRPLWDMDSAVPNN